MNALTGFELPLSFEEFLEVQGGALRRAGMREMARSSFGQAEILVAPAIVYDWFEVGVRTEQSAEVANTVFHLGRHTDLLAPAQMAFVAVVTIGRGLEEEARKLRASACTLEALLLDEAGVFAVGKMVELAHSLVEKDAAERGWGVGAELAPGQLAGWSIAEQRLLTSLLDIESIGVRVTNSGMLVPQKSASMAVGIGPGYELTEVHSPCDYCDLSETCRFRH